MTTGQGLRAGRPGAAGGLFGTREPAQGFVNSDSDRNHLNGIPLNGVPFNSVP